MNTEKQRLTAGAAHVVIKIEINAPVAKIWRSMVEDITLWWPQDFLICEGSRGMYLGPRVGGMLYEKSDDNGGGYCWGNVISFQPEKHLAYVAQVVPPWGGPAQSVVQIALAPEPAAGESATVLTLTDSLIGHVHDELLGSLDEGWRQVFGEGGLKTFVENVSRR